MRVPGVATVATVRGDGEKMFVAVHGDTPRGVRTRTSRTRRTASLALHVRVPGSCPAAWRPRPG
jgi:hypothetical protein